MNGMLNREEELKRRRRKRRRRRQIKRCLFIGVSLLLIAASIWLCVYIIRSVSAPAEKEARGASVSSQIELSKLTVPEYVDVQLIPKGGARSGKLLDRVNSIVIHYVGNPSVSAQNNRDYFAQDTTEVCSHFLVGLEGEIIQCLPLNEVSAASNNRNSDTISIEVCHPDESGKFNTATYSSLVRLTAWLCQSLELSEKDVIRHYDITGKECPRYYVEEPDAWNDFLKDVEKLL